MEEDEPEAQTKRITKPTVNFLEDEDSDTEGITKQSSSEKGTSKINSTTKSVKKTNSSMHQQKQWNSTKYSLWIPPTTWIFFITIILVQLAYTFVGWYMTSVIIEKFGAFIYESEMYIFQNLKIPYKKLSGSSGNEDSNDNNESGGQQEPTNNLYLPQIPDAPEEDLVRFENQYERISKKRRAWANMHYMSLTLDSVCWFALIRCFVLAEHAWKMPLVVDIMFVLWSGLGFAYLDIYGYLFSNGADSVLLQAISSVVYFVIAVLFMTCGGKLRKTTFDTIFFKIGGRYIAVSLVSLYSSFIHRVIPQNLYQSRWKLIYREIPMHPWITTTTVALSFSGLFYPIAQRLLSFMYFGLMNRSSEKSVETMWLGYKLKNKQSACFIRGTCYLSTNFAVCRNMLTGIILMASPYITLIILVTKDWGNMLVHFKLRFDSRYIAAKYVMLNPMRGLQSVRNVERGQKNRIETEKEMESLIESLAFAGGFYAGGKESQTEHAQSDNGGGGFTTDFKRATMMFVGNKPLIPLDKNEDKKGRWSQQSQSQRNSQSKGRDRNKNNDPNTNHKTIDYRYFIDFYCFDTIPRFFRVSFLYELENIEFVMASAYAYGLSVDKSEYRKSAFAKRLTSTVNRKTAFGQRKSAALEQWQLQWDQEYYDYDNYYAEGDDNEYNYNYDANDNSWQQYEGYNNENQESQFQYNTDNYSYNENENDNIDKRKSTASSKSRSSTQLEENDNFENIIPNTVPINQNENNIKLKEGAHEATEGNGEDDQDYYAKVADYDVQRCVLRDYYLSTPWKELSQESELSFLQLVSQNAIAKINSSSSLGQNIESQASSASVGLWSSHLKPFQQIILDKECKKRVEKFKNRLHDMDSFMTVVSQDQINVNCCPPLHSVDASGVIQYQATWKQYRHFIKTKDRHDNDHNLWSNIVWRWAFSLPVDTSYGNYKINWITGDFDINTEEQATQQQNYTPTLFQVKAGKQHMDAADAICMDPDYAQQSYCYSQLHRQSINTQSQNSNQLKLKLEEEADENDSTSSNSDDDVIIRSSKLRPTRLSQLVQSHKSKSIHDEFEVYFHSHYLTKLWGGSSSTSTNSRNSRSSISNPRNSRINNTISTDPIARFNAQSMAQLDPIITLLQAHSSKQLLFRNGIRFSCGLALFGVLIVLLPYLVQDFSYNKYAKRGQVAMLYHPKILRMGAFNLTGLYQSTKVKIIAFVYFFSAMVEWLFSTWYRNTQMGLSKRKKVFIDEFIQQVLCGFDLDWNGAGESGRGGNENGRRGKGKLKLNPLKYYGFLVVACITFREQYHYIGYLMPDTFDTPFIDGQKEILEVFYKQPKGTLLQFTRSVILGGLCPFFYGYILGGDLYSPQFQVHASFYKFYGGTRCWLLDLWPTPPD